MAGDRPEHRHNTNPGEDFSGTIEHLCCWAAKAIVAKQEIIQNSAECTFRIRGVYIGQSLNSKKLTLRRPRITGDRSLK
jgi:hypothetical protein